MRMSELAERSGVSVATIKYYLREGLLAPGRKLSERRAEYDDQHVRRLHLLRVLREAGAIPVDGLKRLVDAVEDRSGSLHQMFGPACDALGGRPAAKAASADARSLADQLVENAGWSEVRPDAPERDRLAEILEVIGSHGRVPDPDRVASYLALIDQLAALELGSVDTDQDRESMMEQMVIGQVAYGQLLLSLRRLAQEHHSARLFDD